MDDWLKMTRQLQIKSYGQDPAELEGKEMQYFVTWNALAAIKELSEATDETRWKPWAALDEGEAVIDKDPFLKEIVDVNHFIANLLVAAGVTDDEYRVAYLAKMEVNRRRQAQEGGYQSRRGVDKCAICNRSFEDVGQYHGPDGTPTEMCNTCGKPAIGEVKSV